jgi:hypothetical protein
MPHRLLNIDYSMLMLNATSFGTLTLAWFSDNLNRKNKQENEDKKRD